ncbi:hypothetical protein [Vitreoscilla filiformis]|uniref:hypothetical protein n=1 Tax=Vitreoscilla filiformis TaxID=63 RepID=UPI0012FE3DBB|nr:hypothetical protein [Vitreoscilla filiformis]
MSTFEKTLVTQHFARALDPCKRPYTKSTLIDQCVCGIASRGRDATIDAYMKGVRGEKVRNRRRMFPAGPLGEILWGGTNGELMYVRFPAAETLEALGERPNKLQALAQYFCDKLNQNHEINPQLSHIMQIAMEITTVKIHDSVIEVLWKERQRQPEFMRSVFVLILEIVKIEDIAMRSRWKEFDIKKLRATRIND